MPKLEQTLGAVEDSTCLTEAAAIQVVVGCDDGYAPHLAVMLLSLFKHSTSLPVKVHVLVPPGFVSRARLDQALGEHAGRLNYYALADGAVLGLKQRYDLTAATYYRLLISDVLPPNMHRVIYLDCDMLVCSDIADLWNFPLGDAIVAAALEPSFVQNHVLGLPDDTPYFNAGLLLIDLARWRRDGIGQAALDFATAHPERLTYNDQCALNWVLWDRWVMLDSVWNLLTLALSRIVDGEVHYLNPVPPIAVQARIVHFNAPGRPWLYMDEHPFKPDYLAYKARTPWRDEHPIDRYPHNIITKALRRRAPSLLPIYQLIRKYV